MILIPQCHALTYFLDFPGLTVILLKKITKSNIFSQPPVFLGGNMIKTEASAQWQTFVKAYPKELSAIKVLEKSLGYVFKNTSLLYEAMTHRSSVVENNMRLTKAGKKPLPDIRWNERIEFLGDSILGLVISSRLWETPDATDEGKLSKIRASLVSEKTLAEIARTVGLANCLVLGKGEEKSGGRNRDALLADSLEALLGAIYLDGGVSEASKIINQLYEPFFTSGIQQHLNSDFKTMLQEIAQEKYGITPSYHVIKEDGPDHSKEFLVECRLKDKVVGIGQGNSKKKSSRLAAQAAFESYKKGNKSWEK